MSNRWGTVALSGVVALVAGFGGAALYHATGLGDAQTRSFLVANPDILPEMADALQRQDAEKRLAEAGDGVMQPFAGAVLGNPEGSKTLVEFSDYNCGYCRLARDHVEAVIAADPEVRVVVREWPIFEGSEQPARMALAAAKQGKFAEFHDALFAQDSRDDAAIARAGAVAGLDMERALSDAAGQDISVELANNQALAQQLGFGGTPSWVAGGQAFEGAVGQERLAEALDAAPDDGA
ncbi:DsbA family protein [Qipengyuania sp. DSG2-2]|uniref:DsbA family protein n=1 Tax=Qipengyuania sp. DGS2-2 TaxID=3349631 RepID=UPI0036D36A6D